MENSSLHFLITFTGVLIIFNFALVKHTHSARNYWVLYLYLIITFISWFSQEEMTALRAWNSLLQDTGKNWKVWAG